mmetsp:Transcript_5904/g.14266  ORF Transcript_5904/g.14266 Transcript_5904/m.14266 type:complete len:204 (+) Transcript_5904:2234-2845(+)
MFVSFLPSPSPILKFFYDSFQLSALWMRIVRFDIFNGFYDLCRRYTRCSNTGPVDSSPTQCLGQSPGNRFGQYGYTRLGHSNSCGQGVSYHQQLQCSLIPRWIMWRRRKGMRNPRRQFRCRRCQFVLVFCGDRYTPCWHQWPRSIGIIDSIIIEEQTSLEYSNQWSGKIHSQRPLQKDLIPAEFWILGIVGSLLLSFPSSKAK